MKGLTPAIFGLLTFPLHGYPAYQMMQWSGMRWKHPDTDIQSITWALNSVGSCIFAMVAWRAVSKLIEGRGQSIIAVPTIAFFLLFGLQVGFFVTDAVLAALASGFGSYLLIYLAAAVAPTASLLLHRLVRNRLSNGTSSSPPVRTTYLA